MPAKCQLFLAVNFELQILFIKFLVFKIGLLYFFETVLNLLIHYFLDVVNLTFFLDQHILSTLFFRVGLHKLFFFFTDFKVEHLDFLDKSDSILTCLVFQCIVFLNRVVIFLFKDFISTKEKLSVIV